MILKDTDGDRAKQKLLTYVDRCFGSESITKERPLQLTNLALRRFTGSSLLQLCKEYWDCHHKLPSCYSDLAKSLEALSVEDQKDFHHHVLEHVKSLHAENQVRDASTKQICI